MLSPKNLARKGFLTDLGWKFSMLMFENCWRSPAWLLGVSHYSEVIMGAMVSQITSLTNVYSTRKIFLFDDVIMAYVLCKLAKYPYTI